MLSAASAGTRLVAVGERGLVLVSDDKGAAWQQAAAPATSTLTAVFFSNAELGWIVGHGALILHTSDGGRTWTPQLDAASAAESLVVEASTLKVDHPAGKIAIEDARLLAAGEVDRPLFAVSVDSGGRGFAVGAFGLAFATTDGGRTWHSIGSRLPNPKGKHLYGIVRTAGAVWFIGEQGALFRSSDDGLSFSEMGLPYTGTLFGGLALDAQGMLVYGLRGNVLRTDDDGRHWSKVNASALGATAVTHAILLRDRRLVLVDQGGQVLLSDDQGLSFRREGVKARSPINAVVQADRSQLVLATVRGVERVTIDQAESPKPR